MPEGRPYPKCFGPYLRYAISTDFRNFEFFDDNIFSLFLLVEFKRAEHAAADFEKGIASFARFGPEFGPGFPNVHPTRYATMRASKAALLDSTFDIWNEHVSKKSNCRSR